jgi:glycosyltransferase involved in cell wall biosynthesis
MDVVVCVKNDAKGLEMILRQILHEIPFQNLIVVYGSSLDDTRRIAEKYTDKVFWDEDKGLGAARNLGIKKATSEIVAMIDADIILTKGWYQQLVGYFRYSDVAAVMGTCVYGYGYKPLEAYWEYVRQTAQVNWGCQNTMFKREAVLKVGNFNEKIRGAGEDYDLYLRLLAAGYRWAWARRASVYHPMTMPEYLSHVRWWARGQPYIDEIRKDVIDTSLIKVYGRQILFILQDLLKGAKLSIVINPTFLIYLPLIRINSVLTVFNELKRTCRQSQKRLYS